MPIIAREVNHHEWWMKSQQIVEWKKFWNLLILRDKSLNLKKIMVGSCYEMVGYLHHPILSWWKGHPFDLLPSKYQVVETCKSYNRKLQDMKNVMWPWFSNENCCECHFKQILRGIVDNNFGYVNHIQSGHWVYLYYQFQFHLAIYQQIINQLLVSKTLRKASIVGYVATQLHSDKLQKACELWKLNN